MTDYNIFRYFARCERCRWMLAVDAYGYCETCYEEMADEIYLQAQRARKRAEEGQRQKAANAGSDGPTEETTR